MEQVINKTYVEAFSTKARYIILMGGRGAGRSTFASQYALARLLDTGYFRCAIMRYILGDVRNSIYQEILDRIDEKDVRFATHINDSMMTIDYLANAINAHGFKKVSGEQKSKMKSLANYNCVIVEEADEVSESDFMQLDDTLRTVKGDITVILLLNPPPKSHWIIKRWFDLKKSALGEFYVPTLKPNNPDVLFINSTYRSNVQNISEQTIANYERYAITKPDHYFNMIKGLVPETVKGRIYTNWDVIDEIPHQARLERHGLDFGFTNDPAAIVDVYWYNGGYIVDERAYATGLHNKDLATIIENLKPAITVADSSEPKSIEEMQDLGITIIPATKGAGSVSQGIDYVQSQQISVTRRSKNIIREYENYAWLLDKEGEGLNEPRDEYNHAMDAIRYALTSMRGALSQNDADVQKRNMDRNRDRIQKVDSTR